MSARVRRTALALGVLIPALLLGGALPATATVLSSPQVRSTKVQPDLRKVSPELRKVSPELRKVSPELRKVSPELRKVTPGFRKV